MQSDIERPADPALLQLREEQRLLAISPLIPASNGD